MNIYITKLNEKMLRELDDEQSMSGLINKLLNDYFNHGYELRASKGWLYVDGRLIEEDPDETMIDGEEARDFRERGPDGTLRSIN